VKVLCLIFSLVGGSCSPYVVILGDSIMKPFTETNLGRPVINQAISGATSQQIAEVAVNARSSGLFKDAGSVVIEGGINNLLLKERGVGASYRSILSAIPPNIEAVVIGVMPAEIDGVEEVSKEIDDACRAFANCRRVKINLESADLRDGVHLSVEGIDTVARQLRALRAAL